MVDTHSFGCAVQSEMAGDVFVSAFPRVAKYDFDALRKLMKRVQNFPPTYDSCWSYGRAGSWSKITRRATVELCGSIFESASLKPFAPGRSDTDLGRTDGIYWGSIGAPTVRGVTASHAARAYQPARAPFGTDRSGIARTGVIASA